MRRLLIISLGTCFVSAPGAARTTTQGLRDLIGGELFEFSSSGDEPLFLVGSADPSNPFIIQLRATDFVPALVPSNAAAIRFLSEFPPAAIQANLATIPISATSGGISFRFGGGIPIALSSSAGPIIAERGLTLGRGQALLGVNVSYFPLGHVRGLDLRDMTFNMVQNNVDYEGCDVDFGTDCTQLGAPPLENDIMRVRVNISLDVTVAAFFATYGLTDWIDVSLVVPIVANSLKASSSAEIVPYSPSPPQVHFFGGTPDQPILTATNSVAGTAGGLGDIVARLKFLAIQQQDVAASLLGEVRLPTGEEADFLGSGHATVRLAAIASSQIKAFSPHVNLGFVFNQDSLLNNFVSAIVGFDQLVVPRVTFAFDLLANLQLGERVLSVPEPVVFDVPEVRSVAPVPTPSSRDDVLDASVGIKLSMPLGITIMSNIIWPIKQNGLRGDRMFTAGLEYRF